MLDLIILLDGKSYYNRKELISCLELQQSNNSEELYSNRDSKRSLIAHFTKDLGDYLEEEITVPYNVCGVCRLTFSSFEIINELLSAIISFNSELFVDDDHGNIVNICDYKNLVAKKKVYPFTYFSKDYF